MYKVFVNDSPIIFTSLLKNEMGFPVFDFENIIIEELIYKLKVNDLLGVFLFSSDVASAFQAFLNYFKVITAGGGLVLNPKKEILFIYRNNIWDLPKGRAEKGEQIEQTAIREVEEECGIFNLTIKKFLTKTYHVFFFNDETRIKETYWYLMYSDYKSELTPQLEEGITQVGFKTEGEICKILNNTYANIQLVYNAYKSNMV